MDLKNTGIRVPFHQLYFGEEEVKAAGDALKDSISSGGKYTRQVEATLRDVTSAPYAFFVTSGTHALELALMALGIGPGDEVVLPSYTFTSTATCIVRQGATPVFADIDAQTWNLDPQDVVRVLSSKTRAVIPVHYAGHPVPFDALKSVVSANTFIIEDAAHAFGAAYRGQPVGSLGDAGCFSFHSTKMVTCGEGGALLLKNESVAQKAEFMREKGTNRTQFLRREVAYYTWVSEGSSFVASDLLAAVLQEQFKKMDFIASRYRSLWDQYLHALEPLAKKERLTLPVASPHVRSSCYIFAILVPPAHRSHLKNALLEHGIETNFHYIPLHSSPYWLRQCHHQQRALPVTDYVSQSILRLPLYPGLTDLQQQFVIESLYDVLC